MLEDFRDHDPNPTVHERAWMDANPYPALLRVAILSGIALIVGLSAGEPAVNPATPSPVSEAARTAG
jgi:hypothetical protein